MPLDSNKGSIVSASVVGGTGAVREMAGKELLWVQVLFLKSVPCRRKPSKEPGFAGLLRPLMEKEMGAATGNTPDIEIDRDSIWQVDKGTSLLQVGLGED